MRIERRYTQLPNGRRILRGLVLTVEHPDESRDLDLCFGEKVGPDGLIGIRRAECRLADGYGDHYVYLQAVQTDPAPAPETVTPSPDHPVT